MKNFRYRLYLFVLVTTLPFMLYIAYSDYQKIQTQQQTELTHLSEVATQTAAEHKQITEGARQLLISLANNPLVKSGSTTECNAFLLTLKNSYVRYVNFGVIDNGGKVHCAADFTQATDNPPNPILVRRTLDTNTFTIGEYYPIKPSGAVINFAYPLTNERVVYASISLEWISDFVQDLNISSIGFVTNILDQNGTVLARNPRTEDAIGKNFASDPLVQEILQKGEGQTTKIGIDNVLRLYAFTSLDVAKSTFVAVGIPQASVYSAVRQSILTSVLIIMGVTILSFAFAHQLGQVLILKQVESLQKLDKLKDEFVSLASHQLRSPMTAIRWLTESLLESKATFTQTQKASLEKIHATTLRLIDLTTFLLNISRLEAGSLVPRPKDISIHQIVDQVHTELLPLAKSDRIHITTRSLSTLTMRTDPSLLGEVLRVLLSNAIRYSSPNGSVSIVVSVKHTHMLFRVTDHGIGIPPNTNQSIFTRFYRADNARNYRPDGNGLGLYLARLIAQKLGGTLTYISKKNRTTFTLSLPNEVK